MLALLINLEAHGCLGTLTILEFHTGKGNKFRKIDVVERVRSIGHQKCQGLTGVHSFTGADWDGKFVGVTKKRWIIEYFCRLRDGPLSSTELIDGKLPEEMQPLEHFVSQVYSANGAQILLQIRWELFRSKNNRVRDADLYTSYIAASYSMDKLCMHGEHNLSLHIPNFLAWKTAVGSSRMMLCLELPAPQAVLELIKCSCKSSCLCTQLFLCQEQPSLHTTL